jgi:uncharacterized surface protein with fasciclin (FAS1) repeats
MKGKHKDIVETALAFPSLSAFSGALASSGLAKKLKAAGPFTIFAPDDKAFAKIAPEELEALLGDSRRLAELLNYHTLRGRLMTWDLPNGRANTIEGRPIAIGATDDGVQVEGANVSNANVQAANGVIHIIDCVLAIPALKQEPVARSAPDSPWSGAKRAPMPPRSAYKVTW